MSGSELLPWFSVFIWGQEKWENKKVVVTESNHWEEIVSEIFVQMLVNCIFIL